MLNAEQGKCNAILYFIWKKTRRQSSVFPALCGDLMEYFVAFRRQSRRANTQVRPYETIIFLATTPATSVRRKFLPLY
jgi:hypothetical protein